MFIASNNNNKNGWCVSAPWADLDTKPGPWFLHLQAIRGLGGEGDFAEHLLWMNHSSGHLIDSLLCQSIFVIIIFNFLITSQGNYQSYSVNSEVNLKN